MKNRKTKLAVEYVPTIFESAKNTCGKILTSSSNPAIQNQKIESSSFIFASLTFLVTKISVNKDTANKVMRRSKVTEDHPLYVYGKTE